VFSGYNTIGGTIMNATIFMGAITGIVGIFLCLVNVGFGIAGIILGIALVGSGMYDEQQKRK